MRDDLGGEVELSEADDYLLSIYRLMIQQYGGELARQTRGTGSMFPSGLRYKLVQAYGDADSDGDLIFRFARHKYEENKARAFLAQFV